MTARDFHRICPNAERAVQRPSTETTSRCGTCRLVLVPHESHGYEARESVERVPAEQIAWFDGHVNVAGPRK